MKKAIPIAVVIFTAFAAISASGEPGAGDSEVEKWIRIKVENIQIHNSLPDVEKIYAVRSVRDIYMSNQFRSLWNRKNEIAAFLNELEQAWEEGLNPQDYHISRIGELTRLPVSLPAQRAELDLLLTDAYLLYASHLLSGKVDPVSLDAGWHVLRGEGDPVALFNAAIRGNNYTASLESLGPHHEQYESMKRVLREFREIEQLGGWGSIPSGSVIEPGISDDRIPLIRSRLMLSGEYPENEKSDTGTVYTPALQNAILMYQRRQGFPGDGKIDEPTIRALNVPVEERIMQLETNMERWRWLPREFSNYYLLVNIANYQLQVFRNGKVTHEYRVIAGKPARKTPVFSSKVSYLVFNPTWTIPPTILLQDVIPEARKSTSYLKTRNIRVFNASGRELNVDSVNWYGPEVNRYIYRQDPGPANALGAVKFMFPNEYNIYMHDTPSRELFRRSERAFSSGCIRVENPLSLAEILLDDPKVWNPESMKKLIATNETTTVNLKVRPDVHVLYWTSWVLDDLPYFRKDIYDRDKILYDALKSDPVVDR